MPTILSLPDAGAVQTTDSLVLEQSGGTKKVSALVLATAFFSEVGGVSVTGSRGGNAALASLLTQLAALGLIVDNTTA